MFCKGIRKIKKELQCVPVYKASAITSKEWKTVKASDKKMKKNRDLYEEEKRRHEEALQRYQKDHMDEMEIIKLHKRCNKKARKTPQPKKAPTSDEEEQKPKKASESPRLIDDPSEDKQKPRKVSRPSNRKNAATKAGKTVGKTPRPKKAPKSPEFVDSSKE